MPPLYGLNTDIDHPISIEERHAIRALRFTFARQAAGDDSTLDKAIEMTEASLVAGFVTELNILYPDWMRHLNSAVIIGVRNEDDGDITARQYRRILDDFCRMSLETGHRVAGGVGSNTDDDTMDWGERVKGSAWPSNLWGVEWHIYDPEENHEFDRLKRLCGGLPLIIGEFGDANTPPLTEAWQAQRMEELWAIHERNFPDAFALCWFQYRDGPNPREREHRYGIRACDPDGTLTHWKASAYTVPHTKEEPMSVSTTPLFTFDHAAVIHNPDGTKAIRWNLAEKRADATSTRVFSLQPHGGIEDRPDTAIGPWESGVVEGDRLVFRVEQARAVFAWQA